MLLKHVDIESIMRRLAEKRIEDAMKEGKFDNLRGMGRPLELEPMPADEDARLTWWTLRILKGNNFTPDEVIWRKHLDGLKAELAETRSENRLRTLVSQINFLVHKLNTLGTNAIPLAVAGVCRKLSCGVFRSDWASDAQLYHGFSEPVLRSPDTGWKPVIRKAV